MSTKIVATKIKQLKMEERQLELGPTMSVSPDVLVGLAQSMLDIVDYLCSRNDDTTELVDQVKPRLEAIIRRA